MFLKAVFSWTCTLCFHCRVKLGMTQLALKEVPGTKSTSSPTEPSRAEPCCAVERQPLLTSLSLWLFCRLRTCIIVWFHTASQHFVYFAVWMVNKCKSTKTCGNTFSSKPTKTAALKTDIVTYFPPKLKQHFHFWCLVLLFTSYMSSSGHNQSF